MREFLISEGVQVPPTMPTETNRQGTQKLLFVINAAVEVEKKIIAIKATVQPEGGSHHSRAFMGMLWGNPSIYMDGLGGSFQYGYKNYRVAEAREEYALASSEAACEDSWKQVPMGFVLSGGEYHESINTSH